MKKKNTLFFVFIVIFQSTLFAQADSLSTYLMSLSLEDLLAVEVSVASHQDKTVSSAPGIVTLITGNEIKNSGARDLMDILRTVPGLDFGAELDNVIGLGVRGNNATEGKVLILLDGQQLNETNFGSFAFGQHILVDNIQRIEIIRGPGSAIYGGMAELAVIKIITNTGADINGIGVASSYGHAHQNTLRHNYQISAGKKYDNGLDVNLSWYYGMGNRSNISQETLSQNTLNYVDSSAISTTNINVGLNYKGIGIRAIYDKFQFDNMEKQQGEVLFGGHFFGLTYEWKVSDKLTIKPRLNWKRQQPWQFIQFNDYQIFNSLNTRSTLAVIADYGHSKKSHFTMGVEYFNDRGNKKVESVFYSNGKNEISYSNLAFFTESNFSPNFVNITLGTRLEYHSGFGYAFVPRIGITKQLSDKVGMRHIKFLYSRAFKAPTIQNVDINNDIQPETTHALEIETSFKLSDNMMVNINFFDFVINNPIVYLWIGRDQYVNYEKTETNGVELEYRMNSTLGYLTLAWSYYRVVENMVPDYVVTGQDQVLGAYPNHKLSMHGHLKINKQLSLNPTAIFYSDRYTYISDAQSNLNQVKFDPTYILNLNILYKDLFFERLNLSFGLYDITDQQYHFINAYRAGVDPIPAPGREIIVKLAYNFKYD